MFKIGLAAVAAIMLTTNVSADLDICHSGSWYNPQTDGQGFSIEVGRRYDNGADQVVVYYYSYDGQGYPLFLVGIGEPKGDKVRINFRYFAGSKAPDFYPEDLDYRDAGYADFNFYSTETAYFEWRPNSWFQGSGHTSQNYTIVKLFDLCR